MIVRSKEPAKPISEAMKEGDEPLRSFSDLMQFYEAKRTDEPTTQVPPPKSVDEAPKTAVESESAPSGMDNQNAEEEQQDSNES